MAKFNPELLEPLIEEPEVAVPVIVAWRGYETARDIKGVYDNYNPPPRTNPSHIPQPFLSGSSLPPPRYPSQSAISGRNINEDDDLPRRSDGEVDYEQIGQRTEGLRRRVNRISEDVQESRDRLDVLGIQRRYDWITS